MRSKTTIDTTLTHHDLSEFAFRNVAKLNFLDRDGLAGGPVESTCRHAMKIDQGRVVLTLILTIDLSKCALPQRIAQLLCIAWSNFTHHIIRLSLRT